MLLLRVELPNLKHGFCRTRVNRPSADASSSFFCQELSPESDVPSENRKKERGVRGQIESIHHPDDLGKFTRHVSKTFRISNLKLDRQPGFCEILTPVRSNILS